MAERGMNTLASRGLEEPFFQLCCCGVSLWFWQEIGFGLHTHVLSVQYICGVVLVFRLRREINFGVTYILSITYSCAPASKTIRGKIMWSQFPPNLSCLQNNPPDNNVEPVPAKSELHFGIDFFLD
jgi:hypothetical protein